MVRREWKGLADGDVKYGAFWMRRSRMIKERKISMLDRCRIVVRCTLVKYIYMCI